MNLPKVSGMWCSRPTTRISNFRFCVEVLLERRRTIGPWNEQVHDRKVSLTPLIWHNVPLELSLSCEEMVVQFLARYNHAQTRRVLVQ